MVAEAASRLSRILGSGKRSSHGWCLVLNCMLVGIKLIGTEGASVMSGLEHGPSRPKGETESHMSQSKLKPSAAAFLVKPLMVLSWITFK